MVGMRPKSPSGSIHCSLEVEAGGPGARLVSPVCHVGGHPRPFKTLSPKAVKGRKNKGRERERNKRKEGEAPA